MSILDVLPCHNKDFTLINVEKKAFRIDPSQELESWFNAKKKEYVLCLWIRASIPTLTEKAQWEHTYLYLWHCGGRRQEYY